MHEGSSNPRLKQELCLATDLAYGRRKSHRSPRAPSMAQPCWEERYRQSALSRCSRLPGWTVRRHCRGLCSSSRQYRSRPRLSNTSCPGVRHHLPPLRRRASPSLLVAVGALLCPPELLRPVVYCHLGRRVEPLAGARCPISSRSDKAALTRATRRCGKLLDLRRWRGQCRSFPWRRAGGESFILFRHCQRKSNFPFLRVLRLTGRQCATHCLLTLAPDPSCQRPKECSWGMQCLPTRL